MIIPDTVDHYKAHLYMEVIFYFIIFIVKGCADGDYEMITDIFE